MRDERALSSRAVDQDRFLQARLRRLAGGSGEPQEAAALLASVKEDEGHSPELLLEMARVALIYGLVDQGLGLLERLNRLHPQLLEGWREHARALSILGRRTELLSLHLRAETALGAQDARRLLGDGPAEDTMGDPSHDSTHNAHGSTPELAPFHFRARRAEDLRRYALIFRGREDCFARQWVDRSKGAHGYAPVRRSMTIADVEDHLSGRRTYGIYLISQDNTCTLGVIDIDLKKGLRSPGGERPPMAALKREITFLLRKLMNLAAEKGLACIAEFSGGKGYHLWFPVAEPVEAGVVRRVLGAMIKEAAVGLEFFHVELFPKQDRLTGKGLGNLVKLPLGVHRLTGKRSYLLGAGGRDESTQLALLHKVEPIPAPRLQELAREASTAHIVPHPAVRGLGRRFPELQELSTTCSVLGRIIQGLLVGEVPTERERRIIIWTIGHLSKGREMLHHLFSRSPDYNRPLLDYEISRIRGTPLGCKRIHALAGDGDGAIPCTFQLERGEYPHPLLHLDQWDSSGPPLPKGERIVNLQDAVDNLKAAIAAVERYLN